ncbi:vomeronasal type-2 receptor 116-like [Lithobates pipiens]
MIPGDWVRFSAIIKLLEYLGWNWVGILTAWDGSGDEEAQELRKKMSQHGICTDYIIQLTNNKEVAFQRIRIISKSAAKVIIVCGTFTTEFYYFIYEMPSVIETITFIFPPSWTKLSSVNASWDALIKYSFIFICSPNQIANTERYENGVNFSSCPNDPILEDIGLYAFHCLSSNILKNDRLQIYNNFSSEHCTDLKNVSSFLAGFSAMLSYAYKAVYVMGNALHAMYMEKHKSEQNRLQRKLHKYVRNVHYTDPNAGEVYFNERSEVPTNLFLQVWIRGPNMLKFRTIYIIQGPDSVRETRINISHPELWRRGKIY